METQTRRSHVAPFIDPNTGHRTFLDEDGHHTPIEDFDFDAIDRALGLDEPEASAIRGWSEAKIRHCAEGLGEIVRWILTSQSGHCVNMNGVALRALVLGLALRPDLCPGGTLSSMAVHLGIHKQCISRFTRGLLELSNGRFFHGSLRMNGERRQRLAQAHIGQVNRKPKTGRSRNGHVRVATAPESPAPGKW